MLSNVSRKSGIVQISITFCAIFISNLVFCGTHFISSVNDLDSISLLSGDSVLFKRGERYFTHINLFKDKPNNLYFGAYGDTSLSKPVLDGSIYHFNFDSSEWKDYEVIKGVKFYKKEVKGLEQVENIYADKNNLTLAREPDEDETVIIGQRNSFIGFFMIDSVDVNEPKRILYDFDNITDWTGADLVTKTQQWSYEIRKIKNTSKGKIELEENTQDPFRKNYGYFIQRHFSALDKTGEWYYDETKGILYFSPITNKCEIYISSNREENNSGFDIKLKNNIKFEDLEFINFKHGIKLEQSQDINIQKCSFRNCIYGVINKTSLLERMNVVNCLFTNMGSYGIRILGNNTFIHKNSIDSVGLSLGCESKGYNNLNGIEVFGEDIVISENSIRNTGYCGIRFGRGDRCKIFMNRVENFALVMADAGGIYTWHNMNGKSRKIIKGNTIKNAFGNVSGTDGSDHHSYGIYLDELSLHFRVDSNSVSNCGTGIYIQNSNNDTIIHNFTENNRIAELYFNHAGAILNGGRLNPDNDPNFDPDRLDSIPEGYFWNKEEGLLYYKNKKNGIVYVKPGNNLVKCNVFIPNVGINKFSFQFRTWQDLTDGLIKNLTGCKDFFRENITDSLVHNAAVFFQASDVNDMRYGGKIEKKVKNMIDIDKLKYLRQVKFWTGWGVKNDTESIVR